MKVVYKVYCKEDGIERVLYEGLNYRRAKFSLKMWHSKFPLLKISESVKK